MKKSGALTAASWKTASAISLLDKKGQLYEPNSTEAKVQKNLKI